MSCWAAIRLSHRTEPSGRAVHLGADGFDIRGQHGRRFVFLRHIHRPHPGKFRLVAGLIFQYLNSFAIATTHVMHQTCTIQPVGTKLISRFRFLISKQCKFNVLASVGWGETHWIQVLGSNVTYIRTRPSANHNK